MLRLRSWLRLRSLLRPILLAVLLAPAAFAQQDTFTAIPQMRYAAATITKYQPVSSAICPTDATSLCVQPSTGAGSLGIAMTSTVSGQPLYIATEGLFECLFSNTPVAGHYATIGNGACVDYALAEATIPSTTGVFGSVVHVIDSTHAIVNMRAPGLYGQAFVTATQLSAAIAANPGPTGPPGVLYYGPSGAITSVKCWIGSTTSTTSGTFTQSITPAGITTLLYVNAIVKSATATASGSSQATITATSSTSVSGAITAPATVTALGALSITLSTSALPVYIEACGI